MRERETLALLSEKMEAGNSEELEFGKNFCCNVEEGAVVAVILNVFFFGCFFVCGRRQRFENHIFLISSYWDYD